MVEPHIARSVAHQAHVGQLNRFGEPDAGERYEDSVMRVAQAPGATGCAARLIKLADLEDHLRHATASAAPDYAWARRQIVGVQRETTRRLPAGALFDRGCSAASGGGGAS